MLQSYATPSSVAQSTHGQRQAAHDPLNIPARSQHLQAHSTAFAEPQSTLQQQSVQPSIAQSTHGQHSAAHNSRSAAPTNLTAQVPAQSQHWQTSGNPTVGGPSTFQPYAMAPPAPVPVCGQLKVVHLAQADHHFSDQLQATADKPPLQPISTYATNDASHPRSAREALCKAGFWLQK